MAIPSTAAKFTATLDPHEELDWRVSFDTVMEDGEAVATGTWTLEVLPEAVALGLTVMTGGSRDPQLTVGAQGLLFWLTIDASFQDDDAFSNGGIDLPMRITFQTDSLPARKRQRTFLVHVEQL